VSFTAVSTSVQESQNAAQLTIQRTGDTTGVSSVDFQTSDGTASQATDYTIAAGHVTFAAAETTKNISVLINDDAYVEGTESLSVTLSTPNNASIGTPGTATIMIVDDDVNPPTSNPIDNAQTFVDQHYHDFLSRTPDPGGLGYWTNEITKCGSDAVCINRQRAAVSDAFFVEGEFQSTGAFLQLVYKASFNQLPLYSQFMPDRAMLIAGPNLGMTKDVFLAAFVQRAAFIAQFPASLTPAQYVDMLNANTGNSLTQSERDTLVSGLTGGSETRSSILRKIAENAAFIEREYNRTFVLSLYFAYLRRDPEPGGFDFWLANINGYPPHSLAGQHALVCAFITSREYQERFSSVVSRSNADCAF
jgi:hypothetical protein